jgi:hypothetical protein
MFAKTLEATVLSSSIRRRKVPGRVTRNTDESRLVTPPEMSNPCDTGLQ